MLVNFDLTILTTLNCKYHWVSEILVQQKPNKRQHLECNTNAEKISVWEGGGKKDDAL